MANNSLVADLVQKAESTFRIRSPVEGIGLLVRGSILKEKKLTDALLNNSNKQTNLQVNLEMVPSP